MGGHDDRSAERSRRWRAANPERVKANAERWRAAHPGESTRAYGARWRAANPERVKAYQQRSKTGVHRPGYRLTAAEVKALRLALSEGTSRKELAATWHLAYGTIRRLDLGLTYRWAERDQEEAADDD